MRCNLTAPVLLGALVLSSLPTELTSQVRAGQPKPAREEPTAQDPAKQDPAKQDPKPATVPEEISRQARRVELHKLSGDATRAVTLALQWLVEHQDEDGRWSSSKFMNNETEGDPSDGPGSPVHDVGVTGLALLSLLADGNTPYVGRYSDAVRKGVHWLISQQDDDSGVIGTKSHHEFIYDHTVASLALAEAWALTQKEPAVRNAAQKALNYLEHHRNPYSVWRYQPRDNDNDTSVTGWATMALLAGQQGGLKINPQALMLAAAWFDQLTDPANGRTGYSKRGGASSRAVGDHATLYPRDLGETNTAIANFCRVMMGKSLDDPEAVKGLELVAQALPEWSEEKGCIDEYYWFYGSHLMYQAGGEKWAQWSTALHAALTKSQRTDGNFEGSWDPVGVWGHVGGRIYSTALNTLSLQSAYRIARMPKNVAPPEKQVRTYRRQNSKK